MHDPRWFVIMKSIKAAEAQKSTPETKDGFSLNAPLRPGNHAIRDRGSVITIGYKRSFQESWKSRINNKTAWWWTQSR
jgi:hypothetical protein